MRPNRSRFQCEPGRAIAAVRACAAVAAVAMLALGASARAAPQAQGAPAKSAASPAQGASGATSGAAPAASTIPQRLVPEMGCPCGVHVPVTSAEPHFEESMRLTAAGEWSKALGEAELAARMGPKNRNYL